jgi:hypothetical protein
MHCERLTQRPERVRVFAGLHVALRERVQPTVVVRLNVDRLLLFGDCFSVPSSLPAF